MIVKKIPISFILLVILSIFSLTLNAQEVFKLSELLNHDYVGKFTRTYHDTGSLDFNRIQGVDSLFERSSADVINFGVTNNTNWIKIGLTNDTNLRKVVLNLSNPIIDDVTLYVVRKNRVDSFPANNYQPFKNRQYNHQFYLFNIVIKHFESVTLYLKLKSGQQILTPVSIMDERRFVANISNSDIRTGIYLGIMMVMLLYNLFIFFTVKDWDYLVYCHYIFWVGLTQATLLGFSHRFLWPDSIWMAKNMVIICGAMSGIATILFAKAFLRTKDFAKIPNRLLNLTIGLYGIAMLLMLLQFMQAAFQLVNVTATLVSLLIIYAAWYIYRQNFVAAKYFLISWSVFFTSILVFVAKDYGLIPYSYFSVHAVEIGSAVEAVLLSFALAGKINILKKEKELSDAEALRISKENEKLIREQNEVLERTVEGRTHELKESNNNLQNAITSLKEAQSQLVESEKMASLGQLTAGVAHEINNPINFVTSNVTPLKRDLGMVLKALQEVEKIALSDLSVAEKSEKIETYKKDLDFEYLKVEIDHLLNGIYEGATRTSEIVKSLRIFSRVDEDDLKLADINECMESTLVIANSLLNDKYVTVIKEFGTLPIVECYPGKLNQVFLNIISNAVYAIHKQHGNSGNGSLFIKTEVAGKYIVTTIKDNGTGMDEKTKQKMFEPFFTTKEVGEGTGLGMSIVYNTIQKHHGSITVETSIKKGTTFILNIPLSQKKKP